MATPSGTGPEQTGRELRRVQRRTVLLLGSAQLFSGIGTGATVSIGSLLAVDLAGSPAWAGSVATVMTLAGALAALPLASLADHRGRRVGLVTGLAAALAGTLLIIVSVVAGNFALLVLGSAGIGMGIASNLQARFAAVDLADAEHRGLSLSTVVWAITIGAVAGPNLIQPGAAVGQALGLPPIAGPFVISGAGLMVACGLLLAGLRPDPLLLARQLAGAGGPERPANHGGSLVRGLHAIRGSRAAMLAVAAVVGAHAMMVGVMSMTPLHLQELVSGPVGSHAGHTASSDALVIIGFTISLHIAGMFALSPLMGWLTDKAGRLQTLALAFCTLLAAVLVTGFGQRSATTVATGLVLLGVGWSAATISGSTLLAESVEKQDQVVVQGVSDMLMGLAGAVGGAFSGLVLSWAGFQGLNVTAAAIAAGVLAAVAASLVRRRREGGHSRGGPPPALPGTASAPR
jgi:MFS family permease